MLKIDNVNFRYPGQKENTLNGLNIEIEEGTFLAIIGSNGSGKSTMCKLLNGIIPHFFVGDIEGNILVDGIETLKSTVGEVSKVVGYVYQDFENSIVRPTVLDEISFGVLNYGYDDYKERAIEALEILDLIHLKDEYIWQLSGGQKHLVALASVLATKPKYIIIDEPVAQLDPYHARMTYEKLKLLNEQYKITIIVIEHHTEFIADYCKEVALVKEGKVKWKKDVKSALTSVEELVECNIFPPQVTQLAYNLFGKLDEQLPITIKEGKVFFNKEELYINECKKDNLEKSELMIELKNVVAGYKDYSKKDKVVIKDMNLKLYEDERIAIVGNNGAGKSTILKMLSRLVKPISGEICLKGENIVKKSPEEVCNLVSYIQQNPEEMFIDDSIEKDVAYFLKSREVENYESIVDDILKELNLEKIRRKDARLLSGGQQRRVSLAIGMGMTPEVILLDEPTASLDISSRKELLKLLEILKKYIKISVVATHDMQLVSDWATRVIVMNEGKIIFDGCTKELFKNKYILSKANLVPPQIVELSHALNMDNMILSVEDVKSIDEVKEKMTLIC
ncbi:MAG: ABC transporter ATP-binding protein [Peptostreptococcaceae bacterium]